MTPDIKAKVTADFGFADRDDALGILQLLEDELGDENSRVLRCVLFLARTELSRLVYYADRARMDWRDVIYWAEYDEKDRQIRDFNKPV